MTSFAIEMGEEKGYSAISTQGCREATIFENLASSGTSNWPQAGTWFLWKRYDPLPILSA